MSTLITTNRNYKKIIPKNIKLKQQNAFRKTLGKENEIDLKMKKIINFLYFDKFHEILLIPNLIFIQNIENKLDRIISENYPEYISIKKSNIDNLKKEITIKYINEYKLFNKIYNNYIKNPKLFQFVTRFIPHCPRSEKYAFHNCESSSSFGKFIQVNNNVICVECKTCYKADLIEMYCKNCKKNYYSSTKVESYNIINNNNNNKRKLPFATWEKYHCGFIINEIMKCIKCKSNFYYDNLNNKLICLNKNCRFEAKPKSIIWKCSICSLEFVSSVKAYNPLEIKIYKNAINYALLIKEKARPYKVIFCNYCGGDISKSTFYHRKECGGELLMSKLNNKEVVVCCKCHGMNFYSQYSWTCPLCDKKIKNKNYFDLIKSTKSLPNNKANNNKKNISEQNLLSFFNKENNNKICEDKNIKLYKKNNLVRNSGSNTINNINNYSYKTKSFQTKKDNSKKSYSNITIEKKNISEFQKNNSFFTIKNLFMKDDINEKDRKCLSKFGSKSNLNNDNSKSLEKSTKQKSTLFDILQKRYTERTLSSSRGNKDSYLNNLSSTNNHNYSSVTVNKNNYNLNNKKFNKKSLIPYNFSKRDSFLRNKTDNNKNNNLIFSYKQKTENSKENSKNENGELKRLIYKKKVGSKAILLNEEIKKNKSNHIYKSIKYLNSFQNYSLSERENERQSQKIITINNKIKNEIENKIDKRAFNRKNLRYIILENESNLFDNNINKQNKKEFKNNKSIITRLLRRSLNNNKLDLTNLNKISEIKNNDKNKIDLKNLKQNINERINVNLSPKINNEEMRKINININPIKNKHSLKNNYRYNYSENIGDIEVIQKIEKNKSLFQLSLKNGIDTLDKRKSKTMSKRRYYQSLTQKNLREKDIKNESTNISNFIKKINSQKNNYFKSEINEINTIIFNKQSENNSVNYMKEYNIINNNTNIIYNTNNDKNDKTNNIKDNNENNKENDNENDTQDNIDLIDFEFEEKANIASDSRINSIINKGNNDLNNILYNPLQFEELIKNCNIPKFDTNDYIYKNSIGEGSFGTIFEVEEKITGKKYAIKKIICIDIQELIKQIKQLELEFSISNDNIIKIYKIEIKCLDFSTYSINVLMELAISDWNQEILNRAIKKDYYKEEELINITNQIINAMLFLKHMNIGHRDIKPQNILIFPNNVFKISDFGEAKNIINLTGLGTLKGCELYMSPALYLGYMHGKKNLVHNIYKSDVFSLGYCLLYAICLNINILEKIRRVNNNDDIRNIVFNSINKNNYSDKFLDIIFKMIDINEEQRYDFENIYNEINNLSNST